MALHDESGQTPERRSKEAWELVGRLEDHLAELTEKELGFVEDVVGSFSEWGEKTQISPKQLFWLRDLVEKYT